MINEDAPLAKRLLINTVGDVVTIAGEVFLVINVNGGILPIHETWEKTLEYLTHCKREAERLRLEQAEQQRRKRERVRQENERQHIAKVQLKIRLERERRDNLQRLAEEQRQIQYRALLQINDRVRHKSFGEGIVLAVIGSDNNQQAKIQFSDRIIKIVVGIAGMEKLTDTQD